MMWLKCARPTYILSSSCTHRSRQLTSSSFCRTSAAVMVSGSYSSLFPSPPTSAPSSPTPGDPSSGYSAIISTSDKTIFRCLVLFPTSHSAFVTYSTTCPLLPQLSVSCYTAPRFPSFPSLAVLPPTSPAFRHLLYCPPLPQLSVTCYTGRHPLPSFPS